VLFQNAKYGEFQPLLTTQDEWTIVTYVVEDFSGFYYWILWILKRHTVRLHHFITIYNDMFDHMDGIIQTLPQKKARWKENFFFAMKLA